MKLLEELSSMALPIEKSFVVRHPYFDYELECVQFEKYTLTRSENKRGKVKYHLEYTNGEGIYTTRKFEKMKKKIAKRKA